MNDPDLCFTLSAREDKPTKTGFGEGIAEAAASEERLVVLGADITASVGLDLFLKRFPGRFISLGIAEQNCAAVAAGLALGGKIPVFSTYAAFAAHRAADQIRISICYNHLHAIIGGAHAGISVGPDGATHQALEDVAAMRALPGIVILSPCDATQARLAAICAVSDLQGPVYVRFGREAVPDFTPTDLPFVAGKGQVLRNGTDLTIMATGHLVWEALQAAGILSQQNISARVVNIHTIKPLDEDLVKQCALETGAILAAEEHQRTGGLGSAIAETLARLSPVPMAFTGMPDCFGESGTAAELMEKFGMTAPHIANQAIQLYKRKSAFS
ncbi:MAG TPA: transketolase C-terminal domain-containing protein [Bacteroidales bacterium]|nr:transketolase C-terminal domain-containing protein [Bacteroidales bacterium]HSA42654.1 transketolase C-terminal domain-containing protein [Bacteroidales bacterium]